MLGSLFRPSRVRRSGFRPRALQLERLDDRSLPSASINDVTGTIIGSNIIVYGHVQDDQSGPDVVNAAGGVNGSCTTTNGGKFEFIQPYSGNGSVGLYVQDASGAKSQTAFLSLQPQLGNAAPYLTFTQSDGIASTITFSGMMYDESPSTCTITISGAATATNIHPDSTGYFSVTVKASGAGAISLQGFDSQGAGSNLECISAGMHSCVIDSFTIVHLSGDVYELRGHVTDDRVDGLTVRFGGQAQAVDGLTATCDASGSFSRQFTDSNPDDRGWVTADCTDYWGIAADTKMFDFV
jgi:hypothetical protein